MIVGENPGSKVAKAQKAGVPLLTEADLKALVKDAPTASQPVTQRRAAAASRPPRASVANRSWALRAQ